MGSDDHDWVAVVLRILDLATSIAKHYGQDHSDANTKAVSTKQLIDKQMQAMDVIVQHIEALQTQGKRDLEAAIASGKENAEFVETTIIPPDDDSKE